MPAKERQVKKKARGACVTTGQRAGLTVSYSLGNTTVEANPRTGKTFNCSFCTTLGHNIDNCPLRTQLKDNANEYILSLDFPTVEISLKERMKKGVMVEPSGGDLSVLGTLSGNAHRMNIAINEVRVVSGMGKGDMEQMQYNVSFIDGKGVEGERQWVSVNVFQALITHKFKKRKYVFDRTIIVKPGWVTLDSYFESEATALSQRIQLSQT